MNLKTNTIFTIFLISFFSCSTTNLNIKPYMTNDQYYVHFYFPLN